MGMSAGERREGSASQVIDVGGTAGSEEDLDAVTCGYVNEFINAQVLGELGDASGLVFPGQGKTGQFLGSALAPVDTDDSELGQGV